MGGWEFDREACDGYNAQRRCVFGAGPKPIKGEDS